MRLSIYYKSKSFFSILICCFIVLAAAPPLTAQVVDLPLTHEAYEFMDRMEAKGYLTGYRDAIRPLPRTSFAQHLLELRPKLSEMTSYEQEEYQFLSEEFFQELQLLHPDSTNAIDRWRIASFDLTGGRVNIGVNVGYGRTIDGDRTLTKAYSGAQVFGNVFQKMGFYFNVISTNEEGALFNQRKTHTSEQGIPLVVSKGENVSGYNTNQSILSYDFGAFDLSIEQTMTAWGNERFGNLILSTKPPSYPKVKLRARLSDWLDFTYIHAELNSNILDSSRSYEAGTSTLKQFYRTVYRPKYFASHVFEVSPWNYFDLTFGESIVYSDRNPSLLYLLPVSFFKSGEHYNRDIDNTQMFLSFDAPLHNGVTMTGSLFVDEISISDFTNSLKKRNQVGYSLGVRTFDLPMETLELSVEYTRINPWVYSHKYAAADYTNNGFTMGHWIGQNADLGTLEITYRPSRSMNIGLQYQLYRKGDTSDVANQYDVPAEQFLYGRNRIERTLTLSASYQAVRDGFIDAYYRYGTIDDRQRAVPGKNNVHEAMIRLRYGLW